MQNTTVNPRAPFVVQADPLLKPLIPNYLESRRRDLALISDALVKQDYTTLRRIGHNMSGSGGAYGLPPISDLGKRLEEAAIASDGARVRASLDDLRIFLDIVKLPP